MGEKLDVTNSSELPSPGEKLPQKSMIGGGRIIFIILLLILIVGSLLYTRTTKKPVETTQTPSVAPMRPDWIAYKDKIGDFIIQYPQSYTVSKTGMTSVQVASPTIPEINTDFRLGIKYKSVIPSQTMNELITSNKPCVAIKPQGGTHLTLNGKIEAQIYMDTPCGKQTSTVVYTVHKDKLYIITVDSQAKFSELKPYVDPIIETLQFTNN